jgi:mannose-6-phosphate isomerase-like protein (cupin superfamily)
MDIFDLSQLSEARTQSGRPYLEFLRVSALSAGLYVLPAGGVDPQQPHKEDEVYYVVRGSGLFRADAEDRPAQAGTILFVPASVEHHFHSITEELTLLVFFAPAESS